MDKFTQVSTVFAEAYIKCALWTELDDENYSTEDLAPETLRKMEADCARFQEENETLLSEAECVTRWSKDEQAGHDFWLTRGGHAAGFWDGDWSEPHAELLTEACKKYGNVDLYVGDDGKIYSSP